MNNTDTDLLVKIAEFVRAHGNPARIENGAVIMTSFFVDKSGQSGSVDDVVKTMKQARDLLGY